MVGLGSSMGPRWGHMVTYFKGSESTELGYPLQADSSPGDGAHELCQACKAALIFLGHFRGKTNCTAAETSLLLYFSRSFSADFEIMQGQDEPEPQLKSPP